MTSNTKLFGWLGFSMIAAAITMMASTAAHANTSALADYELGEADSPTAVAGSPGDSITVDSTGHGFDLTETGSPTYSSNVPAGIGSSLSMQLAYTPDPTDPVNNR